jgi:hypothetical protein
MEWKANKDLKTKEAADKKFAAAKKRQKNSSA